MQFINAVTKKPYSDLNNVTLSRAAMALGINGEIEVAGFDQWRQLGRTVVRHQKSTKIVIPRASNDPKKQFRRIPVFFKSQTAELETNTDDTSAPSMPVVESVKTPAIAAPKPALSVASKPTLTPKKSAPANNDNWQSFLNDLL